MTEDIRKLPGLKHRDFKPCALCGRGMMHDNALTFFKIKVERYVVDINEVRRAHGMEMMMGGNALLANVMGPDNDLAKRLDVHDLLICDPCAISPDINATLWGIYEKAARNDPEAA